LKKKQKSKRGRGREKKSDQQKLQSAIYKVFSKSPQKRYNARQVSTILYRNNSIDAITLALKKLEAEGAIKYMKDGKYQFSKSISSRSKKEKSTGIRIRGKIDATRSGAGYLVPDEDFDDIYISPNNLNSALHRDTVMIELLPMYGRRKPEGRVISIVQRASQKFVGNLRVHKNVAVVFVDHPKIKLEIQVKLDQLNEAKDGDKVVIEIEEYGDGKHKYPWGKVHSVLTGQYVSDVEMQSILINNGFIMDFHKDVMAEAEALSWGITEQDLSERLDIRQTPSFTIDPSDAKDFDDALSFKELDNGNFEVGIHIADVSHYVKPNSLLDEEALQRSTSVYLVDRVAPMLPEALSNGLCSLRPKEDKFCFSAIFEFDPAFEITKKWFGKTIIHSDQRFSYEEAQKVLEEKEGPFSKELAILNDIAKKLREQKFKQGAISLDSVEVKFLMDELGKPIGIYTKQRKDAHLLIEDFMLLANRSVAEFIAKKSKPTEVPFVYRVHDLPDPDRLADLALFAGELGLKLNMDTPGNIVKSFREISENAKKDEKFKVLEPLAIRTMAKAVYTTENIGHYGLAFPHYTHFTSPIRRYSDVLVHRLLEKNIKGVHRVDKAKLEKQCQHISAQERKAMEAERESVKYKQAEYLQGHIGEVFAGVISGMIEKGIFVELKESKVEGMILFNSLDEPYTLKGGNTKAFSKYSGDILRLGEEIKVKVLDVDLEKRQIEFEKVS
jgi:ribonuclease R